MPKDEDLKPRSTSRKRKNVSARKVLTERLSKYRSSPNDFKQLRRNGETIRRLLIFSTDGQARVSSIRMKQEMSTLLVPKLNLLGKRNLLNSRVICQEASSRMPNNRNGNHLPRCPTINTNGSLRSRPTSTSEKVSCTTAVPLKVCAVLWPSLSYLLYWSRASSLIVISSLFFLMVGDGLSLWEFFFIGFPSFYRIGVLSYFCRSFDQSWLIFGIHCSRFRLGGPFGLLPALLFSSQWLALVWRPPPFSLCLHCVWPCQWCLLLSAFRCGAVWVLVFLFRGPFSCLGLCDATVFVHNPWF